MSDLAAPTDVWTVGRLLTWTQDYFRKAGLESPRLCAEILLAHAMQTERLRLYTCYDEAPAEPARDHFRAMVREAVTGKPIAYLTGRKEFFSLAFEVTPDVLIPRPETEILVERVISILKPTPGAPVRILDLCTGSGCIAIALARHLPAASFYASDISESALRVAAINAARHGVAERIEFRPGDLFAPWSGASRTLPFDFIVCNPPYVAVGDPEIDKHVRDHEPSLALFAGPEGLDVIRRVTTESPAWLTSGGHLLVEIGYSQADAVRGFLGGPEWQDTTTYRDGGGHERVVHARRV